MAEIRDRPVRQPDINEQVARSRRQADEQIYQTLKNVQKDRTKLIELARVDVKQVESSTREAIAKTVGEMLKGQIPGDVYQTLVSGTVAATVLDKMLQRLANSVDVSRELTRAPTAEAARQLASDPSAPQQALRWAQFVQRAQHVPGADIQGHAGSAAPKSEGTTLAEMLGSRLQQGGANLRSPQLIERAMVDLSPRQRAALMQAVFGERLAVKLAELGIKDPLAFVKSGTLPGDRAALAGALDMSRGKLLALLYGTEMLKIGPGKGGELGMRPELLSALRNSGIAMLGTLAALKGLSHEELAFIYARLRGEASGFFTSTGGRPVLKRDLIHWSRVAGRRPSQILLPGEEDLAKLKSQDPGLAQELVQAWYLENLFWQELAYARRHKEKEHQGQGQGQPDREDEDKREEQQRDRKNRDDNLPDMQYDPNRQDHLMCFWITDFGTVPGSLGGVRRMYVCVDPRSGAIIPQAIEAEYVPSA